MGRGELSGGKFSMGRNYPSGGIFLGWDFFGKLGGIFRGIIRLGGGIIRRYPISPFEISSPEFSLYDIFTAFFSALNFAAGNFYPSENTFSNIFIKLSSDRYSPK